MRRALLLFVALVVAGCSTPPEADRVTPPTASASDGAPAATTPGEPVPLLVEGENDDLAIRLVEHSANATTTRLAFDIRNKRADDVVLNYAYLHMEPGALYLDLNARLPAGEERRVSAEESSGDPDDRRAPWSNVTFYYTRGIGTADGDDAIVALDLRGRGLP